jgi:hypothetical protein
VACRDQPRLAICSLSSGVLANLSGSGMLAVERLAGLAALILALLAIMAAVEGLAADRTAGISSGAAQARRGARHAAGIERLALRG